MGINIVAGNSASQEMAVVASQAAAGQELDSPQSLSEKKLDTNSVIQKALSGKLLKLDSKILGSLIKEMASLGITASQNKMVQKAGLKVKDEYDLLLSSGKSEAEDKAELNKPDYIVQQIKNQNKNNSKQGGKDLPFDLSPEAREAVREYIDAYASYVVNASSELDEKIDKLEQKLQKLGVTPKDLLSLQKNVKNSIRSEIAQQIKDAYLKRVFSPKKSMEYLINNQALDGVLDSAVLNDRLGKEGFGGYNTDLQGTTDQVIDEARSEVRDFIKHEMEKTLIQRNLTGKEVIDDLDKLLKVGHRAGFKPNQFIKDWKEKKNDLLGLLPQGFLESLKTEINSGSQGKKEEEEGQSQKEKDLLMAQLRAIFMERALKGNFLTVLQTAYKMRRFRNGLIKLGISYVGVNTALRGLKKEGRLMAIKHLMELLKQCLTERASFYNLNVPAYKLVKNKIDALLSNLKRLGRELTDEEFANLRDEANLRMFNLTLDELKAADSQKRGKMLKVLQRISEESKIPLPADLSLVVETT